jgi:hypothetical protein
MSGKVLAPRWRTSVKVLALQSRMLEKGQARPSLMWAKVPVLLSRT